MPDRELASVLQKKRNSLQRRVGRHERRAGQRIGRSLLAGLAGLLITSGALWLERACRVQKDEDAP